MVYCLQPEIPGANGQGKTKEEARESLAEAIKLILGDRREDGLRGIPPGAIQSSLSETESVLVFRKSVNSNQADLKGRFISYPFLCT
jgi:predicted RNase H-like HicB family nuclease